MDSRIILTRADFSANNIGRYVELSGLTKKVLAKQTQYLENSSEAIALNDFLNNLTRGGFIGGENPLLKTLIIPALAASYDEMMYNIAKLDDNGYPINEMSQEEIEAEHKALYVKTKQERIVGMKRVYTEEDENAGRAIQLSKQASFNTHIGDLVIGNTYPSYSILAYNNQSTMFYNTQLFREVSSLSYLMLTASKAYIQYGATTSYEAALSHMPNVGFIGISINPGINIIGVGDGDFTINTATGSGTLISSKEGIFEFGGNMYNANYESSLFAFGSYMDSTKLNEFKEYVNTLMNALNV